MNKPIRIAGVLVAGLSVFACVGSTSTDVATSCLKNFKAQTFLTVNRPPRAIEQLPSGGIVESHHGFVAFERYEHEVVAFDSSGSVRWKVGRSGNGPFEFADGRAYERLWFGSARWVHAFGNRTAVFDGRSIIVMYDSSFINQIQVPSQTVSGFSRVHFVQWVDSSTVLLAVERDPVFVQRDEDRYRVDLLAFAIGSKASRPLYSWKTLPWPTTADGIPVHGVGESSAALAVRGSCAVFSDGHTDTLRIVDLREGRSMAFKVDMPERFTEEGGADTYARLGLPQGRHVPVRYRARIKSVAIDPSGQIWIMPARRAYDGEVWRVPRGEAEVVKDTLDDARERALFSEH